MRKKILHKFPELGSSNNPDKVSLAISSAVRLGVAIAAVYGVDFDSTELETHLLTIWAGVESVLFVFGFVRRLYNKHLR